MPKMKGHRVSAASQRDLPEADSIVKILLTAYAETNDLIDSINFGRVDYYYPSRSLQRTFARRSITCSRSSRRRRRRSARVKLPRSPAYPSPAAPPRCDRVEDISEHGAFLSPSAPRQGPGPTAARAGRTRCPGHGGSGGSRRPGARRGRLEFCNLPEEASERLQALVKELAGIGDLDRIRQMFPQVRTEDLVLFTDLATVSQHLEEAIAAKAPATFALPHQQLPAICQIVAHRPIERELDLSGENLHKSLKTSEAVFASFRIDDKTFSSSRWSSASPTTGRAGSHQPEGALLRGEARLQRQSGELNRLQAARRCAATESRSFRVCPSRAHRARPLFPGARTII